jgi:hypothetical protein
LLDKETVERWVEKTVVRLVGWLDVLKVVNWVAWKVELWVGGLVEKKVGDSDDRMVVKLALKLVERMVGK